MTILKYKNIFVIIINNKKGFQILKIIYVILDINNVDLLKYRFIKINCKNIFFLGDNRPVQ